MNFLMQFQLNNLKKKNFFEKYFLLNKKNKIKEIYKKASKKDVKKYKII